MGGWMAHNPELADELFIENCPEPWKSRIEADELTPGDVPWEVAGDVWAKVDQAYGDRMADQADAMRDARKYGD